MVKYEALILGLKTTILMKVKRIKIFDDYKLIMKEVANIYNTKDGKLQPYKEMVTSLPIYFNEYKIESIPRDNIMCVDVMASATSLAPINIENEETILIIKNIGKPSHEHVFEYFLEDHYFLTTCINVCEWYQDVFDFVKHVVIPIEFDHYARTRLKTLAIKYVIIGDLLYRRYFDGTLLICLMRHEVDMDLHQAHDGECG